MTPKPNKMSKDTKVSAETLLEIKILHSLGVVAKTGKYKGMSDKIMNKVKEYTSIKCKEQREICYQGALTLLGDHAEGHEKSVANMIKDASEPK